MPFIAGLLASPFGLGAWLLYDRLLPLRACKEQFLGCLWEPILALVVAGLVAGFVAGVSVRGPSGLFAMVSGLVVGTVATVLVMAGGDASDFAVVQATIALLACSGVPATIACFLTLVAAGSRGPSPATPATIDDGGAAGVGDYWDGTGWTARRQ